MEFPDTVIARLTGNSESEQIHDMRHEYGIRAAYKMVDTCAAEFAAETPYYYSCSTAAKTKWRRPPARRKCWCWVPARSGSVRVSSLTSARFTAPGRLRKEGYETIIVNNNPETVSTDFDIADKLYFEPLTPEDVESIVDLEKPDGAVVQFGGQTAIKLTESLMKMGVPILGTCSGKC